MAGGAEKRRAAAMKGCGTGEGRTVLSPLTSFYQEQHNRSPQIQVIISASHINLMEEFIAFCKTKKAEQDRKCSKHPKKNLRNSPFVDKNRFKNRVGALYGDCLPAEVIDEICQLVHENSILKCKSCIFPIEDLVIRVLQILSVAASKKSVNQNVMNNDDQNGATHPLRDRLDNVAEPNGANEHSANLNNKILKDPLPVLDTPVCFVHKAPKIDASFSYPEPAQHINKRLKPTRPVKHIHPPGPRLFQDENMENRACAKSQHIISSQTKLNVNIGDVVCLLDGWAHWSSKRCHRNQHEAAKTNNPAIASAKASPEVQIVGEMMFKDRCSDFGKLADQLYNQKNLPHSASRQAPNPPTTNPVARAQSKITTQVLPRPSTAAAGSSFKHHAASSRFIANDIERRYYFVLCGLAHSQWNCLNYRRSGVQDWTTKKAHTGQTLLHSHN